MTTLPIALTSISLILILFYLSNPSRVLSLYIITRPMIQPFIFLQQTFFILPYSYIWAGILPVLFVVNFFRLRWVLLCPKSLPLFLILIAALLSMITTEDIRLSVDGVIKLSIAILAYSAAYNLAKNIPAAETIAKSIVWSSVVPLLFGFYQSFTGQYDQLWSSVTDRTNSVFGVGNGYGIYLTIAMCALMMLLLKPNLPKKERLIYIGLMAAMCASQVLALNRGTWIALAGAIVVALWPYRRKVKTRWFVAGGLAIAIAFSGIILKRMTETTYRWDGREADTFGDRIAHWESMVPEIMERPVLGYGIGTTGALPNSKSPHNDYLRFAMDIGIPGGLFYIYFLASLSLYYLARSRVSLRSELWRFNFPMAVLSLYFIVISTTQNITQSFINFGFFLMLNGAVVRLNRVKLTSGNEVSAPTRKARGLLLTEEGTRVPRAAAISRKQPTTDSGLDVAG